SQKLRDIRAVYVGRLGAGLDLDLIAHAPCKSRFRLDTGMLDEAGFKFAFNDCVRLSESFINGSEQRQFLPAYWEGCRIKLFDRLCFPDNRGDGFPPIPSFLVRKN